MLEKPAFTLANVGINSPQTAFDVLPGHGRAQERMRVFVSHSGRSWPRSSRLEAISLE